MTEKAKHSRTPYLMQIIDFMLPWRRTYKDFLRDKSPLSDESFIKAMQLHEAEPEVAGLVITIRRLMADVNGLPVEMLYPTDPMRVFHEMGLAGFDYLDFIFRLERFFETNIRHRDLEPALPPLFYHDNTPVLFGEWSQLLAVGLHEFLTRQGYPLDDIFGNRFRPVQVEACWLTPDVVALAQAIYEERRFDHMPILADALEEAGCTDEQIVAHCRSERDHARGCWVIDLLLAKTGNRT